MDASARRRTNRFLLALVAAWVAISLAIGAPASADQRTAEPVSRIATMGPISR
jgi:hypothetical protein